MRTFMIAATLVLALSAVAQTASAGDELDKAVGSGPYLHPTGPVTGAWHPDKK